MTNDCLRALDRQILSLDHLSDDDLNDIASAEIPVEYRYSSDQLPAAREAAPRTPSF